MENISVTRTFRGRGAVSTTLDYLEVDVKIGGEWYRWLGETGEWRVAKSKTEVGHKADKKTAKILNGLTIFHRKV